MSAVSLADLRKEYSQRGLRRNDLIADPIQQFSAWFADALEAEMVDVNAMTLATIGLDGIPSARVVLLKAFDEHGFVFFTNYESVKAQELEASSAAALAIYWLELERQVCVRGPVERTSREESAAYFASRPRGSQLGAWASGQSAVLQDRAEIEQKLAEAAARFGEGEIPLPENWGGYRVRPIEMQFWQGRPSRLHDRFRYRRTDHGWQIDRLSP